MIITFENEISREVNFENTIDEFVSIKASGKVSFLPQAIMYLPLAPVYRVLIFSSSWFFCI